MLPAVFPRLSEAKTLLPLLRRELVAAAPRYTLPTDVALELLPIAEDGVFGYELVPDRETHTYLTIGYCQSGEVILRRTPYRKGVPSALRLATLNGISVVRERAGRRNSTRTRDTRFAGTSDAVESGLAQLVMLFPGRPRRPVQLRVEVHRYLDAAIAVAREHLGDWNPHIQFVGIPNEAQFGYLLTGDHGERGELVSRRPDMWVLRWKSPAKDIYEEWAVELTAAHASGAPGVA